VLKYFYIHPTIYEKGDFLLKTAYQNMHKGKQRSGLEKHIICYFVTKRYRYPVTGPEWTSGFQEV
jgi:hypothetical protein